MYAAPIASTCIKAPRSVLNDQINTQDLGALAKWSHIYRATSLL